MASQELEDQGYRRLAAHYEDLWKREEHQHLWYQAHLFDAWKALRGQSKGLQRQRRLIKRLQAENAELRNELIVLRSLQQFRGDTNA